MQALNPSNNLLECIPQAKETFNSVAQNAKNTRFFYKQHFYKQRQTEIGEKSSKS